MGSLARRIADQLNAADGNTFDQWQQRKEPKEEMIGQLSSPACL